MNNYAGTLIRDIKIYPSSWYYNACVHGFLEILAWGLGEEGDRIIEEQILQHDGTALIPSELAKAIFSTESVPMPDGYAERAVPDDLEGMKRIAWWWIVVSYKAGYMTGNDKNKSLDNHELVETVCGSLFNFKSQYPNLVNLGQLTNDTAKKIEFLNNWFTHDKHNGHYNVNCSFCGSNYSPDQDGRIYDLFFTRLLSIVLGNGPEVFPNRFWDGKPNGVFPIKQTVQS